MNLYLKEQLCAEVSAERASKDYQLNLKSYTSVLDRVCVVALLAMCYMKGSDLEQREVCLFPNQFFVHWLRRCLSMGADDCSFLQEQVVFWGEKLLQCRVSQLKKTKRNTEKEGVQRNTVEP